MVKEKTGKGLKSLQGSSYSAKLSVHRSEDIAGWWWVGMW